MSNRVLSTKLKVDEIDHFEAVAKQQGLSKAGLLKHLVQDCLNSAGKPDGSSHGIISRPITYLEQSVPSSKEFSKNHRVNSENLAPDTKPGNSLNGDVRSSDGISVDGLPGKDPKFLCHLSTTKPPAPPPVANGGLPRMASPGHASNSPSASTGERLTGTGASEGSGKIWPIIKTVAKGTLLIAFIVSTLKSKPAREAISKSSLAPLSIDASARSDYDEDLANANRQMGLPYYP